MLNQQKQIDYSQIFESRIVIIIMLKQQPELIKSIAAQIATKKHLKRIRDLYKRPQIIKVANKFSKNEEEEQIQCLDVSDKLKTISHQKKTMNQERWQQMMGIHQNISKSQHDYRFFLMIISQANYRKLAHPSYYKMLVASIEKYPTLFFSCIEKDIPRTLPDSHPFQKNLRNILYCYAMRNPSLLYCQGMNYIGAFLLMNSFSQEESFWMLVQLIQDTVMPDYFKNLSTISITSEIFTHVLKQVFPQLAQEMEEVSMDSSIFLVGWFVCLFTKGFINSVSQYILEKIILETRNYSIGFVILKISLGVMAALLTGETPLQFQKDFRSLKDTIEKNVYQLSLKEIKNGIDYLQFDYESYKKLERIYQNKNTKNYDKMLKKQLKQKKLSLPSCNQENIVCLHRVQIQKKIGTIDEVLILKPNHSLKSYLIQDYFPHQVQRSNVWYHFDNFDECPVTHHSHICNYDKSLQDSLKQTGFDVQKSHYKPVIKENSGEERLSKMTKIQDIYNEFSEYFVVSDEQPIIESFQEEEQKCLSLEKEERKDHKQFNPQIFFMSIGNTFKKAMDGIKLLRH